MTPSRRWLMVLTLCLGSFMILLDTTIVYVATPSLMADLHAPIDEVLWVFNGYLLTFAALLITTGRLADVWGPKALFISGLAVFTLASAACGLSQNVGELIAARVLQGIGGALLTPQTMTLITSIFPPERRGSAFGIFGAVVGIATVGGPTIGGLLVTVASWRWIFFLNVPVGIIAIAATLLFVVDARPGRRQPLDPLGVLLGTGALFLVVFGLIQGQSNSWDGRIWACLGAGLAIGAGFVIWEARALHPLVPLDLFRDRDLAISNGASMALNFAMQGIFIPFAIYPQSVLG
ncbi:MAG: MFS transporter, partial [Candidatus Dormibacteraceae bacterium]